MVYKTTNIKVIYEGLHVLHTYMRVLYGVYHKEADCTENSYENMSGGYLFVAVYWHSIDQNPPARKKLKKNINK